MTEKKKPTADAEAKQEISVSPEVAEKLDKALKSVEEGNVVPRERVGGGRPRKPAPSLQEHLGLPTEPYAVVGDGDVDDVDFTKIIFKNKYAKKSLSVYHLQRRLRELGYTEVDGDQQGYYGDRTLEAVHRFQKANGWDTESLTREQLEKLFDSDPNVRLV